MDGLETARRLIAEAQEKQADFLDLGNLQLTEVPAEVCALTRSRTPGLRIFFRDLSQATCVV